jgi:hypothetical protein
MEKTTKQGLIEKHLMRKKRITAWEAIELYGITRLAHHIHVLRTRGWQIGNKDHAKKDRYGNTCNYTEYIFGSKP